MILMHGGHQGNGCKRWEKHGKMENWRSVGVNRSGTEIQQKPIAGCKSHFYI
jgi:hypothetical protein